VILDRDTDDQTAEILARLSNVVVQPSAFRQVRRPAQGPETQRGCMRRWTATGSTFSIATIAFPFPLGSEPQAFCNSTRKRSAVYGHVAGLPAQDRRPTSTKNSPPSNSGGTAIRTWSRGLNGSYRKPLCAGRLKLGWLPGVHRTGRPPPTRLAELLSWRAWEWRSLCVWNASAAKERLQPQQS